MTSAFDDDDSERFVNINNEYDDEDDDVLDNWEDVEDEEEKAEKERKAAEAEALRKQQEKEKRLAKREEERKKALEEEARLNAPSLTKEQLEQAQRDADAKHAEDLFGGPVVERKGVDSYVPVNPDDFTELKDRLVKKLRPFEKDEGFVNFVKDLATELSLEMTSDDIRKVSTSLTNVAHEKGRLEREAAKKTTAKSKKSLKITKKSTGKDDMLEDFSHGGYDNFSGAADEDAFDFM